MHLRYVHEKEQVLRCGQCNKIFMRREELQTHRLEHKGGKLSRIFSGSTEILTDSLHPPSTGNQKTTFQCETCAKKFELKHSFQIHLCVHGRQTRLQCAFCVKQFLSQSFLEKHTLLEHADRLPSTSRAVELEVGDDSIDSSSSDRELCLSDEDFDASLGRLLVILNDGKALKAKADHVLSGLIRKAGHQPVSNEDLEPSDQLRANLTLLLRQINEDDTVKSLLDSYSIDEVLVWLVNPIAISK